MKIALFNDPGILSRLIELENWGPYSHAALLVEDNLGHPMLIESYPDVGVRIRSNWGGDHPPDMFELTGMTDVQAAKIEGFARLQIGKAYDWYGVLRFVYRGEQSRTTANPNAWFCSELVFEAFQAAGINLLSNIEGWKVSPSMISYSPLLTKIIP